MCYQIIQHQYNKSSLKNEKKIPKLKKIKIIKGPMFFFKTYLYVFKQRGTLKYSLPWNYVPLYSKRWGKGFACAFSNSWSPTGLTRNLLFSLLLWTDSWMGYEEKDTQSLHVWQSQNCKRTQSPTQFMGNWQFYKG